jgi:hypothetical protein
MTMTDQLNSPEAARCLICGDSALKALPPGEAPAAGAEYVCAHCFETRDPFHGCPKCPESKGPDAVYNAGRLHRGACHTHRTTWILGSNLFSSWRDETEQQQRERWREIEGYDDLDRLADRYPGAAA